MDSPLQDELDDWGRRAAATGLGRDDASALLNAVLETHFPPKEQQ